MIPLLRDIPLDGYGIKYKYGLFKQTIENGFQCEQADDWTHFGDPWCIRREEDRQLVEVRRPEGLGSAL